MKLSWQETTTLTVDKVTSSMILKHFEPLVMVCVPSSILLFALIASLNGMRLLVAVLLKIEETHLLNLGFPDIVLLPNPNVSVVIILQNDERANNGSPISLFNQERW